MSPEYRSFVGAGDEVYPVNELAGTRPAGSGIHGEVLPPDVETRLMYGDLMQEAGTRTGCGGEGYTAETEWVGKNGLEPMEIPTRGDIVRCLQDQHLDSRVPFYVNRELVQYADYFAILTSAEHHSAVCCGIKPMELREIFHRLYVPTLRQQFPEFWSGERAESLLWKPNMTVRGSRV